MSLQERMEEEASGQWNFWFSLTVKDLVLLHAENIITILNLFFFPSSTRPNLQMTASSGSDSKKTAIIPMPQRYTELSQQAGSGMWPSTREEKLSEAAAPVLNPSTSLPTFCQDSSSLSSQNFLSRLLSLRRKSHPVPSSQRFPFLRLGKVPTP